MGVISCGTTMLDEGLFQNLPVLSWDTTVKTANLQQFLVTDIL